MQEKERGCGKGVLDIAVYFFSNQDSKTSVSFVHFSQLPDMCKIEAEIELIIQKKTLFQIKFLVRALRAKNGTNTQAK